MKKFYFCVLVALGTYSAGAQNKMLTMEDAMVNFRTTLAPENLRQLQFIKGTSDYVYLKKIDGKDIWVRGNFKSQNENEYLTLSRLNAALKNARLDTMTSMPAIQFSSSSASMNLKGSRYKMDVATGQISLATSKELMSNENFDESSAGYAAYLKDDNLFVEKNGSKDQVTKDGSKDIVYASAVHQSEFGITKGTFWSNNGNVLAFYRMDQHMVPDYPIINWTTRPAKVENIRYPMAGDSSHHVTVGVYNAVSKSIVWLKTGVPAEQYLTNIAWSPDDKSIFLAVLNRGQNHMWLNEYDAATGNFIRTLFEETNDKYVEPLNPVLFVKNNPSQFVWQSRRDGWNHLYLYDRSGKLLRQLTSGPWEVTEVKGFNEKGDQLFFTSTKVSPVSKNLSSVNLKNSKITDITQGDFVHNTQVASSGDFVIDSYSSTDIARKIELVDVKTGKRKMLLNASNPLNGYATGKVTLFKLKSVDGQDLYCRMFKPVNFDSTRKYPVIVYWYGGPHAQLVLNSWNAGAGDYWFQYMAERGFLVMSLDTRGSANRGRMFEQTLFRNAGQPQMEDMMTFVQYIRSLPFADNANMGLFGWSYGGFMTTSFLLNHPGIFKAAVAGGPVIDWKYYEIMYTERYMDTPQENAEGFSGTDLTKKVKNLKDHLLIIHGMQDPVVVQQHSVRFVKAAIDNGIQLDYMIYPGHEHNVIGKDRAHLYQKVTDYLMLYLDHTK